MYVLVNINKWDAISETSLNISLGKVKLEVLFLLRIISEATW